MIRHRTLVVRTPEGIAFPLSLASPLARFLALGIDLACIYIVTGAVSAALSLLGFISPDVGTATFMLASAVVSVGYPMVLEWRWRGQTIGKKLLRLQVMDGQGLRLQASQIVVRNLMRVVDVIPAFYAVGGVAAFLNARGQRLGDLAANTIVVHHVEPMEPDFEKILPGKYNSFRELSHLAARLRQNVSPQEAGLALEALLRRDQFEDQARLTLFAEFRAYFERVVRFPAEITDGLSDEQYVRNVVDVLFR